ncbi:MAG: hypothetical protein ACTSWD_15105 [Candidatus Heimdallarchaeota archaeon]
MNKLKLFIILGIVLTIIIIFVGIRFPLFVKTSDACCQQEDNEGNKITLEIFYPQICQLTIPDLEKTDKEDKFFDACWQAKIIYDAVPHMINTAQKIIELTQDPDKGCNIDRCGAQCVDSTCYAKSFDCSGGCPLCSCPGYSCYVKSADCDCADCPSCECQPECVGHCSNHHTSYGSSLPCKSDIIDFYNKNGDFRVCPDLYLGNALVSRYYSVIEQAEEKAQKSLCPCQKTKNVSTLGKMLKEIKEASEELKNLIGELKDLTDKCLCSKKSLCEVKGCACETKGCCPLSQCTAAQMKKIDEKIEEIEKAINELVKACQDDYEHEPNLREYIK